MPFGPKKSCPIEALILAQKIFIRDPKHLKYSAQPVHQNRNRQRLTPSSPNLWFKSCIHSGVHCSEPSLQGPFHSLLPQGFLSSCQKQRIIIGACKLTNLTRRSFSPFTSRACIIEYACKGLIPLRSVSSYVPCQLSKTPVAQPNRNSSLTLMISSLQNFSVSRISDVKSSVVTPPVRSSMASLYAISNR